jgi:hypothetical protein
MLTKYRGIEILQNVICTGLEDGVCADQVLDSSKSVRILLNLAKDGSETSKVLLEFFARETFIEKCILLVRRYGGLEGSVDEFNGKNWGLLEGLCLIMSKASRRYIILC